jgi:aminoglycoside phosphotransferase (APT) family kinase protein
MKLTSDQHALILRELRRSVRTILAPELASASARDAAKAVDRILTLLIVEDEAGEGLAEDMAKRFDTALEGLAKGLPSDSQARAEIDAARDALASEGAVSAFASLRTAGQHAICESDASTAGIEIRRLIEIERDFLASVAEQRDRATSPEEYAEIGSEEAEGCSITPERLEAYLRQRLPEAPDLHVRKLTLIPGGRSKETLLVALAKGGPLPEELILRKDRPISVVDTRASDEYALLRVVHAAGVPVAEPFLHEPDPEAIGGACVFVERVRGEKRGEYFPEILCPDEGREQIGRQWAGALAQIHAIPLSDLTETHLDLEPDPRAILERAIEGSYRRLLDFEGPPSIGIELAHRWLLDHRERALGPPSLCHNDLGLHNLVIDGPNMTALVDWELAGIGTPASDVARCRHTVEHLMPWDDFIAAYLEAGGSEDACEPEKIDFYQILGLMGGAVTSRVGGSLFYSGQKRDLLTANSGYDSHHRSSHLLAEALVRAIERTTG